MCVLACLPGTPASLVSRQQQLLLFLSPVDISPMPVPWAPSMFSSVVVPFPPTYHSSLFGRQVLTYPHLMGSFHACMVNFNQQLFFCPSVLLLPLPSQFFLCACRCSSASLSGHILPFSSCTIQEWSGRHPGTPWFLHACPPALST